MCRWTVLVADMGEQDRGTARSTPGVTCPVPRDSAVGPLGRRSFVRELPLGRAQGVVESRIMIAAVRPLLVHTCLCLLRDSSPQSVWISAD